MVNSNYEELAESIKNAISEEHLEDIDAEYFLECIKEQVDDLLETNTKKNYLKKFDENLSSVCKDYANGDSYIEPVGQIRDDVYESIIDLITNKFHFNIDLLQSPYSIKKICKNMYKFFVLEYTDNVAQFIEMFIIENKDEITSTLDKMDIGKHQIDNLSMDDSVIIGNISSIISIIIDHEISFSDFIEYINHHPDSSASADMIGEFEESIFSDTDEIINYIMESLESEESGFSSIYTNVTRNLYQRFSGMIMNDETEED